MRQSGLWATALMLVGTLSPAARAQHAHPAPERLGTVHFATTCAASVRAPFERAVALLHSFAYTSSEQAFRAIAVADPACAMAHWGIAMSHYHPLWQPPDGAELRAGAAEATVAGSLAAASSRERQFIAATIAYYRDSDHVPHPVRAKGYADAMAATAAANPADAESQIFYALALLGTAPPTDRTHANQKRAAAILEPLYRAQPNHPGIAHYLIHAYDSTELAARGLAAARAYSKIAPSAPHALHMPSHIFTRLGYWDDSIISNTAARRAAREQHDLGEELHAMDYLTYAYLQCGRDADAGRVVGELKALAVRPNDDFKVGYAATAMPVRFAVERRDWPAALALEPLPGSVPNDAALVFWARAIAAARSGRAAQADPDIAQLEASREQLAAAGDAYAASQVDVLGKEARAWQVQANGQSEAALGMLRAAAEQEDATEKLPLTPGPIVPAREQLGELLLELKRPADALREFEAALLASPGRCGATRGALGAAAAGGGRTSVQARADCRV